MALVYDTSTSALKCTNTGPELLTPPPGRTKAVPLLPLTHSPRPPLLTSIALIRPAHCSPGRQAHQCSPGAGQWCCSEGVRTARHTPRADASGGGSG
jgi:hypothetical protein